MSCLPPSPQLQRLRPLKSAVAAGSALICPQWPRRLTSTDCLECLDNVSIIDAGGANVDLSQYTQRPLMTRGQCRDDKSLQEDWVLHYPKGENHAGADFAVRVFITSWGRPEHPDRRLLVPPRPDRHKEPVEFGHKQRCSRARYRRHTRDPAITGRVSGENINDALTATHVNAMTLGIGIHIVGIAAGRGLGYDVLILGGQRHQDRRAAKDHEHSVRIPIDRHWKVRSSARRRQRSGGPRREVHDLDRAGIRHVDKNPRAGWIEPKALGVALQTDAGDLVRVAGSMIAIAPLP